MIAAKMSETSALSRDFQNEEHQFAIPKSRKRYRKKEEDGKTVIAKWYDDCYGL